MIEACGLVAGYGLLASRRPVLHGLDLDAGAGRVTAVVGPNGAGKTTLFRVLLGFLRPVGGAVRVGGLHPGAYRRSHGIAFLPEVTPLPAAWTPEELFEEGCDLQALPDHRRAGVLETARRRAALPDEAYTRPLSGLSKGQVRRAVLAYVLLDDPAVVLLDEPLGGMDADARVRLRTVVREIAAGGAAVLMSSHELAEVARMADDVVVLADGRIARRLDGRQEATDLERAVLGEGGSW